MLGAWENHKVAFYMVKYTTASISFKICPTRWVVTGQMIVVNTVNKFLKPVSYYCLNQVTSKAKIGPHHHSLLVHVFVCSGELVILCLYEHVCLVCVCVGGERVSINKYMKEGRWSWTGSYSSGTGAWAHISPGERSELPLFQCQTHNRAHRTDTKKYPHRSVH